MALAECLYAMAADGHGDFVCTVAVGHAGAIVALHQRAVNLELYAIHGDVGVQIGHMAAHGER